MDFCSQESYINLINAMCCCAVCYLVKEKMGKIFEVTGNQIEVTVAGLFQNTESIL